MKLASVNSGSTLESQESSSGAVSGRLAPTFPKIPLIMGSGTGGVDWKGVDV